MKKILLVGLLVLTAGSAMADDSPVMQHADTASAPKLTANLYLSRKITRLEELVDGDNKVIKEMAFEIDELERKVAGMQKQITILHAKKVDKK